MLNKNNILNEKRIITGFILRGKGLKELSIKLSCSKTAAYYKMKKLFKEYHATNRIEFILSVFGEMLNNLKLKLNAEIIKNKTLNNKIQSINNILTNIVKNKDDTKKLNFWIKKARDYIL